MLSGDLRLVLHAGRTKQNTAIAARVRINGVLMTITYFAKNINSCRPARAVVRRLDDLLRKVRRAYAAGGALWEKGDASKNELATIPGSGLCARAISKNGTSISCTDET